MRLFLNEPRFNQKTGKPAAPQLTLVGWLCDFCGKAHLFEDEEIQPTVKYTVHENGESEPQFHELRIPGFEKINIYDLFNEHPDFIYCEDWNSLDSCESDLLFDWMKKHLAVEDGKITSDTPNPRLSYLLYQARIDMLAKVLAEKTYTPEMFKLGER